MDRDALLNPRLCIPSGCFAALGQVTQFRPFFGNIDSNRLLPLEGAGLVTREGKCAAILIGACAGGTDGAHILNRGESVAAADIALRGSNLGVQQSDLSLSVVDAGFAGRGTGCQR